MYKLNLLNGCELLSVKYMERLNNESLPDKSCFTWQIFVCIATVLPPNGI